MSGAATRSSLPAQLGGAIAGGVVGAGTGDYVANQMADAIDERLLGG